MASGITHGSIAAAVTIPLAGGQALAGTLSWGQAAGCVAVSVAAAAGQWTSPDLDQNPLWRWLARVGRGKRRGRRTGRSIRAHLMKHRGITHWWGLPALAWPLINDMPGVSGWLLRSAWIGWVIGHLLGDLVWGHASRSQPAGIPLLPASAYVGLGLDADGVTQRWVGMAAIPVSLAVWAGTGIAAIAQAAQ